MAGKVDHVSQAEAIASVRAFLAHAQPLREHLAQILQSPIFRGSPRSQDFLKYIVQKALDGDFDALKERSIGTELFGRSPAYDTGEDAIVRVAASDVRKRLLQYYGTVEGHTRFRIDLPSGSYIPAFCTVEETLKETGPKLASAIVSIQPALEPTAAGTRRSRRLALYSVAAIAVLIGVLWMALRTPVRTRTPKNTLPWSVLFTESSRRTHIILCDTNISMLHTLLHFQISLSDYANRRYLPRFERPASPDMQRVIRDLAGMDYTAPTAAVDAVMSLRVSQLAGSYAPRLTVRPARSLQLRDFDTDDNFILLGSPNSNPWHALFSDQLDFSFLYSPDTGTEVIRNNRPQPGEPPSFIPNAMGGATGQAFSIVALLANPHRSGNVLLVAGTTAEATEAAEGFVTDLDAFASTLRRNGLDPNSSGHFEAVLKVTEMAGAPAKFEMVAFHRLH